MITYDEELHFYGQRGISVKSIDVAVSVVGKVDAISDGAVGALAKVCEEHEIWGLLLGGSQAKLVVKGTGKVENQIKDLQEIAREHYDVNVELVPGEWQNVALNGIPYFLIDADLKTVPKPEI